MTVDSAAMTQALLDALDYGVLGGVYCDEGGDAFWEAKRGEVARCGQPWADAVRRRMRPGGASLYAGAGVAELPAIVAEVVDLKRDVRIANLREAECEVLAAGLRAVGLTGVEVLCRDAGAVAGERGFDHLCAVSLLTDPETWPVVSDVTYGRLHPAQLELQEFGAEWAEIAALSQALFGGLVQPGWITTTFEEAPWLLSCAARCGAEIDADDEVLESPLVGDGFGFLAVGA